MRLLRRWRLPAGRQAPRNDKNIMHKTNKLTNGLDIITAPIAGAKTVTILFMAATGSRFENKANSGISHFLEHMFFKGTRKRPTTLAITSELDKVGGEYNAFTGKEYTGYYVKVEAGQFKLALDVLSDMLLNSRFKAEEIEREKAVVIEELNMYRDNPMAYIEDLFEQCLYGDSPAGRDTLGSIASIKSFSRAGLSLYYNSQYSPDQAVIALAGKIDAAAVKLAAGYFKNFSRKKYRGQAATDDRQAAPALKLHFKKTDQAHLSLGVRAVPYGQADELTVKLTALILGGTMSSRLFTHLRERNGLAYYVRTHEETYTDSGYLATQAGVPIDKLESAIKIILRQYREISTRLVGAAELNKAKQCLIGRTALSLESSDSLASWYGRQAILNKEQAGGREILTPEEYYKKIKKITAADIRLAAAKIFAPGKLNLAVIGPYQREEEFKKMLKI